MISEFISCVLIFIGAFFIFSGAVGVLRFDEFYAKVHSVGVADTVGVLFSFLGLCFHFDVSFLFALKILLLISILWITSVTSSIALARSKNFFGK